MIHLRKKEGVSGGHFRRFFKKDFIQTLASTGVLTELRTQSFLPWVEKLWDTPHVAHDNPTDQHLHASVSLGFVDQAARSAFLASDQVANLSASLSESTSATPCGVVRRMYWVRSSSLRIYAAAALPCRVRLVGSRR